LALIVLSLVIVACGGGSESSGTSAEASASGDTGSEGSGGKELAEFTLSTEPISTQAAISLGLKKGIFEKQGIDLKIKFDPTSADAMPLMLKGERDAVFSGVSTPVTAAAQGLPVEYVGGVAADQTTPKGSTESTILPADSTISDWKELEGKTIGANSLSCCFEFYTNAAVAKNGGDAKSINWVSVPYANSASALEQGRVDAITTLQPFVVLAELSGAKLLGDPLQEAYGFENPTMTVLSMSNSFVEENPELTEEFMRGVKESSEYANDHPSEALEEIHELAEVPMDVLEKMPLPEFTSTLSKTVIEDEAKTLEEYEVIDEAPAFEEVVWSGAELRR
jgi:NitT/TauT family transport system substrate-binding protein